MLCRACRGDVAEGSRFCPSCGAPLTGSEAATATVSAGQPPLSHPIDDTRFIPGTILASRYRIVSLLGRGGMGEVYRADDLKLGQQVALKFLSEDVAHDAARLARFHQEVRVARQVTHPNVCRVYDIGEADGQHFLSMEYVDGENLASLLHRIGHFPYEKAVQVARELCAGLAAAHAGGVLHRDLKPANILLDCRGHVRIADFGLAALIGDRRDSAAIVGTPAYMAPEQRDGRGSVRSDIYALGLILHEIFTGRFAIKAVGAGQFRADWPPSRNAPNLLTGLDPAVEAVITRCLELDPAMRPPSARAVAAALPGGDPLAALLATGETPSPEMIAAAGDIGTVSRVTGIACLALVVGGLLAAAVLSERTVLLRLAPLDKEPAVLEERARGIAEGLGYIGHPADEASGYETDLDYIRYVSVHDKTPRRWNALKTGRPPAVTFWYRQSLAPMSPSAFTLAGTGQVTSQDPPPSLPGMVNVRLDPAGRLLRFSASSPPASAPPGGVGSPDWARLFSEASLPFTQFTRTADASIPLAGANARAAWDGTYPEHPDISLRVEAAALDGRPVYFEVFSPWNQSARLREVVPQPPPNLASGLVTAGFTLAGIVFALLLARRNLREGRGDRRGAWRLSIFLFVQSIVANVIAAHHTNDFLAEATLLQMVVGVAAYRALFVWVAYIALESHVRRVWPEMLIGWSRLVAGRLRDPLVGRDVLLGVVAGVAAIWMPRLAVEVAGWLGRPGPLFGLGSPTQAPGYLPIGAREGLNFVVEQFGYATLIGVSLAVNLLALNWLLRSRIAAIIAVVGQLTTLFALTLTSSFPETPFPDVLFPVIAAPIIVLTLVRYGVLASIVMNAVGLMMNLIPVTFEGSVAYAGASRLIAVIVLGLAIFGFRTALAGRPVLGGRLLERQAS